MVQYGPATPWVRSSTLMPWRGRLMGNPWGDRGWARSAAQAHVARRQADRGVAAAVVLAALVLAPPADVDQRFAVRAGQLALAHHLAMHAREVADEVGLDDTAVQ